MKLCRLLMTLNNVEIKRRKPLMLCTGRGLRDGNWIAHLWHGGNVFFRIICVPPLLAGYNRHLIETESNTWYQAATVPIRTKYLLICVHVSSLHKSQNLFLQHAFEYASDTDCHKLSSWQVFTLLCQNSIVYVYPVMQICLYFVDSDFQYLILVVSNCKCSVSRQIIQSGS